jgi:TRAP-type mannitol/chloroaromatic compound transport system substrate-binding protein
LRAKYRWSRLGAVLLFGLAAAAIAAEPVRLTMPIAYGTHLPGIGDSAVKLVKLVAERSGGALQLDLKEPGDGTNPQEILEKVAGGEVAAGFDAKTYVDWFSAGNGRKFYRDLYQQANLRVHVIPCGFGGGETSGWFAKEIKTRDDLKGLRMRIFGLGARVMAKLGATAVLVPGGKLGEAFDRKEIDAAEFLTPTIDLKQGLQEHVKLLYIPGWHQPETVLELLVNRDKWDALGSERQTLLEGACKDLMATTIADNAKLQAQALAQLTAKGVRMETWSGDLPKAFRDAWNEVAKEESDRDIYFRVVLTDLENFRAQRRAQAEPPAMPPLPPKPETDESRAPDRP